MALLVVVTLLLANVIRAQGQGEVTTFLAYYEGWVNCSVTPPFMPTAGSKSAQLLLVLDGLTFPTCLPFLGANTQTPEQVVLGSQGLTITQTQVINTFVFQPTSSICPIAGSGQLSTTINWQNCAPLGPPIDQPNYYLGPLQAPSALVFTTKYYSTSNCNETGIVFAQGASFLTVGIFNGCMPQGNFYTNSGAQQGLIVTREDGNTGKVDLYQDSDCLIPGGRQQQTFLFNACVPSFITPYNDPVWGTPPLYMIVSVVSPTSPTVKPVTAKPTAKTKKPTLSPTVKTKKPTPQVTIKPTKATNKPTNTPTCGGSGKKSCAPSKAPTKSPMKGTSVPSTSVPSKAPSLDTSAPTSPVPTLSPSLDLTDSPSVGTNQPTSSFVTFSPTGSPSGPSVVVTSSPTVLSRSSSPTAVRLVPTMPPSSGASFQGENRWFIVILIIVILSQLIMH